MSQEEFRIFLSAVTSEFGRARDAVAADLRSLGASLRVQSDFRQEAGSDTTLKKLHDYIRDASAVVCIIGKRSGTLPPLKAAEPFAHMLPAANRLSEAEPMCRRALAILVRFTRATGHRHPNFETGRANYVQVLAELGRTETEIENALKSIFEAAREPPP